MSSLSKLNQKWSLTAEPYSRALQHCEQNAIATSYISADRCHYNELSLPKQPGEQKFYELLDLILDGVMPKDALVEIFVSREPDFANIAQILSQQQSALDLQKPYIYLREQNQGLIEIDDPCGWINKAMEIKPQLPAGEDLVFMEFGELSEPAPPNRRVEADLSSNSELSLLQLWLQGASIEWPRLYPKGHLTKYPYLPMTLTENPSGCLVKRIMGRRANILSLIMLILSLIMPIL